MVRFTTIDSDIALNIHNNISSYISVLQFNMYGTTFVIIILFAIYEMRLAILFNKFVFGCGTLIYVELICCYVEQFRPIDQTDKIYGYTMLLYILSIYNNKSRNIIL